MQAAERIDYITVEDYLADEESSEVRHEYLGGLVYAMAGETRDHNRIVGNLYKTIDRHIAGGPCKLYISDIRVNFRLKDDEYYYYPDLVVTCDPRDTHPRFIRYPKLIIEVLSPGTERVDRREKFFAYTTMESLEEYVLIAQEEKEATVFRRANNWKSEKIAGPEVTFASLPFTLPFTSTRESEFRRIR
jgi:Uma2 family endonuclease